MRPSRPVLVVLTAGAALALGGCGGGTSAAGPGTPTGTAGTAGTAAAPSGPPATGPAGPPGTWTTGVRPAGAVTDGRTVAGTTRQPEGPTMAVALDAGTGTTRWTVALGDLGAATTGHALLLSPGGPLVATWQQDTPGSGLTPASSTFRVARLDPQTGRPLWTVTTTGPAVAAAPDVVLTEERQGDQTAARGTVALDPADGHRLWTAPADPVLVEQGTAVLTRQDLAVSTVLTAVDAATGTARWTSSTWAVGAVGSRATALTAAAGHLLVEASTTRLAGETTELRVRDVTTGQPVGPALPAPHIPGARHDRTDGTAVVHEKQEQGAGLGVYGVDMATGRQLWALDATQATQAAVAGGGLVWVKGKDGYVALDDRTGTVKAQGLDQAPVLVLDRTQIVDDGAVLRSGPLPG